MKYLILSSIALLASCQSQPESGADQSSTSSATTVQLTKEQYQSAGIRLGAIEQRSLSNVIKANGMLDVPPQNMVTVSAPFGGFVKNTDLLQGMKVKQGQVLAVMEHPDYIQLQQDYLETRSQLDMARTELDRQKELAAENINAGKTLQQAETSFVTTKAKLEGLSSKLKMINIAPEKLATNGISNTINLTSPIAGFVTQVHVNRGMYVNPNDVLFKIVDTRHLHAELVIFENDILKIQLGQTIRLRLANDTTERLAVVYMIGKEISADRTVRVHGHLEKEDVNLLPGMYFSALVETSKNKVPALPDESFVQFEGRDYIFKVNDSAGRIYEMVEVNKGLTEEGYTELLAPEVIATNMEFVVKGAYDLLSYLKNTEED